MQYNIIQCCINATGVGYVNTSRLVRINLTTRLTQHNIILIVNSGKLVVSILRPHCENYDRSGVGINVTDLVCSVKHSLYAATLSLIPSYICHSNVSAS